MSDSKPEKATSNKMAAAEWLTREGILGHIIDSYVGLEKMPGSRGHMHRCFEWEEEESIVRGNAEAFTIHLGLKFGLELSPAKACFIHAVLRELGEVAIKTKKDRAKRGPAIGKFVQPEPQKRYVRPRPHKQ